MQMGAGRPACGAYIADHLTLANPVAERDLAVEPAHMRIGGIETAGMANADIVAIATLAAAIGDHAVARRIDRRTRCRGEVDAPMHFRVAENRVTPLAEK